MAQLHKCSDKLFINRSKRPIYIYYKMSYTEIAVDIGLAIGTAVVILASCIGGIITIICAVRGRRSRPRDDSLETLV